jgi:hypothetical protein
MASIQVCIQTWGFNKRLCWMLSSILQQTKTNPVGPEVTVNLAYIRHTGVEEVISFFQAQGLKIAKVVFNSYEEGFSYRGLVRNQQLKACNSDWVLFADSDMVYPPNFFYNVAGVLEGVYKDSPKCLFLQRYSNEEEASEALVNAEGIVYPCLIEKAYERASKLKLRACRNVGAGYCQFANMKLLQDNHGGLYQPENLILDGPVGTSLKNRSDRNFRITLGAEAMSLTDTPLQIHLQHPRQKNDYPK